MMKKFELSTEHKINWLGKTLYRIKACISFTTASGEEIKAGDLGGYVEKEENLSHDGNAWIYGNAEVCGDARVCGNAEVCKQNHWLLVGPIGSRFGFTTFFRDKDNEITVSCGCFLGKLAAFKDKVTDTHGNNHHATMYMNAAALAELHIELLADEAEENSDV